MARNLLILAFIGYGFLLAEGHDCPDFEEIEQQNKLLKALTEKMADVISELKIVKQQNVKQQKMIDALTEERIKNAYHYGGRNLVNSINHDTNKRDLPAGLLEGQVAFYSYMSKDEHTVAAHHTLVFDVVKTNIRNPYSKYTGIFTAPEAGLYVFTWNIYSDALSYALTELVINNSVWNSGIANSAANGDRHSNTGIVVAPINTGDVVFIRTHSSFNGRGNIESSDQARSTFSGWKIN